MDLREEHSHDPPAAVGDSDLTAVRELSRAYELMCAELGKVIVGQAEVVEQVLTAMFCQGHCLLVGVPGLAKTLLVKTISDVLHLSFQRVQFTPDLMPSDITGTAVLEEVRTTGKRAFRFVRGPLFANMVLADEINRTPPKTQAALLEAMQEHKVTIGGESRALPDPFLVVATQNPIEQEGTYPLPEAQLDRFMFSLNLDYPSHDDEIEVVRRTTLRVAETLGAVVSLDDILAVQQLVLAAPVSDHVIDYAVRLASSTRHATPAAPQITGDFVEWGAGPRASQYLVLGAKAVALLKGKVAAETEDVREVALPVLQHRVITNYRATGAGKKARDVVTELVKLVQEKNY